jgi:nucleoid DNA-binding protein
MEKHLTEAVKKQSADAKREKIKRDNILSKTESLLQDFIAKKGCCNGKDLARVLQIHLVNSGILSVHDCSLAKCNKIIEAVLDVISGTFGLYADFEIEKCITLGKLGSFHIRDYKNRLVLNPQDPQGEKIMTKAKSFVSFRSSSKLRERLRTKIIEKGNLNVAKQSELPI